MKSTYPFLLLFFPFYLLVASPNSLHVKVTNFDGSSGYVKIYCIDSIGEESIIRIGVPGPNNQATVIYNEKLEKTKKDELVEYLKSIDYSKLEKSYSNPNVMDGYQVFYEIKFGDEELMEYFISNRYHKFFIGINQKINSFLSQEYKMDIPTGNEFYITPVLDETTEQGLEADPIVDGNFENEPLK